MTNTRINGDRLWASLMRMAEIGATAAGGSNRQALTEEDAAGRGLFTGWAEAAGCQVSTDAMGNLFARRPGTDDNAAAILIGSHLDTQPTGGRFDGVYGVLAGLEVIRTLNDLDLSTRAPIVVASWTNEEGARFAPAMMGSAVWAGVMAIEDVHRAAVRDGVTVLEALQAIDALGDEAPFPVAGAFELHIEQGPILEAAGDTIGVVTGVQGIRWYDLSLTGVPVHAGPTPMEVRRDPVPVLAELLPEIYQLAAKTAPWGRVTVSEFSSTPASRNTVPERVQVSIDIRHPEQPVLDDMDARLRELVSGANSERVGVQLDEIWHSPAVQFDARCIEAVRTGARASGVPWRDMVSGAGHDSVYVARVAPTGMIFIPCRDGLSHNEAEYAEAGHITAGCDVLLQAVLAFDESSG